MEYAEVKMNNGNIYKLTKDLRFFTHRGKELKIRSTMTALIYSHVHKYPKSANKKGCRKNYNLSQVYAEAFIPNPNNYEKARIKVEGVISPKNIYWSNVKIVKPKVTIEDVAKLEAIKQSRQLHAERKGKLDKWFVRADAVDRAIFKSAKKYVKLSPKLDHNFKPIKV